MNRQFKQALAVLVLAAASLAASEILTPRIKLSDTRSEKIKLEQMIPARFAGWVEQPGMAGGIVDPVQEANLNRIYSQTLSRVYVGAHGERVMISIAYGEDQRKYLALHYPEVCYPAQGFAVKSNHTELMQLPSGKLPVRRLETFMGPSRHEPVTYWTTMGDYTSFGGMPRRMIELHYGLQRIIPDGLLFRVSSIGPDSEQQFANQERFIRDLLANVPASTRIVLTGEFQQ